MSKVLPIRTAPAFSYSAVGAVEFDPFNSGLVQRPQGADCILNGGIVSITDLFENVHTYTDANGDSVESVAGVPYNHHILRNGVYVPVGPLVQTNDSPRVSSAFLNSIKGAGYIEIDYTPSTTIGTATKAVFSFLDAAATGGALLALGGASFPNAFRLFWNSSTSVNSSALTWTAGQTYRIRLEWSGSTVTVKRDGTAVYGPTAQAAGLSTIEPTFFIGTNTLGTIWADGAIGRIHAGGL